jgi:hypothetical protein
MSETFEEQLARVKSLGNRWWDLAPDDRAAVRAVLVRLREAERDRDDLQKALDASEDRLGVAVARAGARVEALTAEVEALRQCKAHAPCDRGVVCVQCGRTLP